MANVAPAFYPHPRQPFRRRKRLAEPFAYVTNSNSDTVSVIDTTIKEIDATVAVGSEPIGIAVTPDGARLYVTNSQSDTVSVIDTASNEVLTTVAVGDGLRSLAVTPNGAQVYVANSQSNTVSIINTLEFSHRHGCGQPLALRVSPSCRTAPKSMSPIPISAPSLLSARRQF